MKCGEAYHFSQGTEGVDDDKLEALAKSRKMAWRFASDEAEARKFDPPCDREPWVKVTPDPDSPPQYSSGGDGKVKASATWRIDVRCFAPSEWSAPAAPSAKKKGPQKQV